MNYEWLESKRRVMLPKLTEFYSKVGLTEVEKENLRNFPSNQLSELEIAKLVHMIIMYTTPNLKSVINRAFEDKEDLFNFIKVSIDNDLLNRIVKIMKIFDKQYMDTSLDALATPASFIFDRKTVDMYMRDFELANMSFEEMNDVFLNHCDLNKNYYFFYDPHALKLFEIDKVALKKILYLYEEQGVA